MGLDDGARRADGRVPLRAGERAPLLQRDHRPAARPLGLRVGASQHAPGIPAADFAAQTGQLLDRLALAVRDSGDVVEPENPGSGACGAGEALCAVDLPDARHNGAWRSFRTWAQSTLALGGAPATLVAGVGSPPLTLSLASAVSRPTSVTLRSSSTAGAFATTAAGPWTSALAISVVAGTGALFYYRDTRAGRATLTASAPGTTRQRTSRSPCWPARPHGSRWLPRRARSGHAARSTFTAKVTDAFGNAAPAAVRWSVAPASLGHLRPRAGARGDVPRRARARQGDGDCDRGRHRGRGVASSCVPPRSASPPSTFRRTGAASR